MDTITRLLLMSLLILSITGNPLFAQDSTSDTAGKAGEKRFRMYSPDAIVITATKSVIKKNQTGSSITIITEDEIKKSGKKNVGEILRTVPGLTVRTSSVPGGEAAVSIRGARSENVLVLIDGVEVNDPISTNRSYNFANLTSDNIEKIEIIRGPQSVLYGSDAAGGVINIITKKGKGKPIMDLSFEGGSYSTFIESASVSGAGKFASYSVAISQINSKGISRAAKREGTAEDPEKDGYKNTTLSSKLGIKVLPESLLTFSFHYNDAEYDIDDGALADDPNNKLFSESLSTKINFRHSPFSFWKYNLSLSQSTILRKNDDPDSSANFINSWFEGKTRKAEFQNIFSIGEINDITAGAEIEQDSGSALTYADYGFGVSNSELKDIKVYNIAYYLQNHLKLMKRLFIIAGIRADRHEEYGKDYNYNTSLSFITPIIGTRLKANYGTGFKAPSIYQLYEPTYGEPSLEPEDSKNYDIGFEQNLLNNMITIEGSYFHNSFKNKIVFGSSFKYENTGEVETSGYETALTLNLLDSLNIKANYTRTKTEDKDTGKRLIRIPENTASININWEIAAGANIDLIYIYIGERDDAWWDSSTFTKNDVTLPSYYKIDLAFSYNISKNYQIFGRVENITNKDYQETYGYQTPGISVYGGFKAML